MIFAHARVVPIGGLVLLALTFASVPETHAQLKIGTVDVNRVFQNYGKTKELEAKINEAKNAATKEFNERADAYKKAVEEINQLNQQLDAPTLSAAAKATKAKERDEKITSVKEMEREITEFRQTREQELQEEMRRAKEQIIRDITGVVLELVKAKNFDLVFDMSGASFNGFSPVLFARPSDDFTDEVVAALKSRNH